MSSTNRLFILPIKADILFFRGTALTHDQLTAGHADFRVVKASDKDLQCVGIDDLAHVRHEQDVSRAVCERVVNRRGLAMVRVSKQQDTVPIRRRNLLRVVGRIVRNHNHLQEILRVIEREYRIELLSHPPFAVSDRQNDRDCPI